MKKLSLHALYFLALNVAQASAINVNGVRAKAVIEIGDDLGLTDAAMGGKRYMEVKNVVCTKTVTEEDSEISCTMRDELKKEVVITTKDLGQKNNARDLRAALVEMAGPDVKVNNTTRRISVKSLTCSVSGYDFDLDDIDYETTYKCEIIK